MPRLLTPGSRLRQFGPLRLRALSAGGPLLLFDPFTDADGTALASHTMQLGGGWTVAAGGAWDINGNRARLVKTAASRDFAWANAGKADVAARVVVRAGVGGNTPGLALRISDANNGWLVRIHPTGSTFSIFERNGGVFTERAVTTVATSAGTDYVIRAVARGPVITATVNGGNQISYASATLNQTATTHGIHDLNDAGVSTVLFDDFEVRGA